MIQEINRFYEDVKLASKLGKGFGKKVGVGDYEKVVFCGVGGSGIVGEIVKSLNLNFPVYNVKQSFPKWADSKTLCFVVSYSGNTKETIAMYKEAKKKKCKVVIISSGGKLEKMMKDKDLIVKIPSGYLPREAFAYLFIPVLNILGIDYSDCLSVLKKFDRKACLRLAKKLEGKVPFIYASSESLRFVAYRWQTDFNENAKILAHYNYFPELAHNEIEAKLKKNHVVIFLIDKESEQVKKAAKMLKPIKIKLKGRSLVSKILYGIYFGSLTSYFLAENEKVDYAETKRILKLKK